MRVILRQGDAHDVYVSDEMMTKVIDSVVNIIQKQLEEKKLIAEFDASELSVELYRISHELENIKKSIAPICDRFYKKRVYAKSAGKKTKKASKKDGA